MNQYPGFNRTGALRRMRAGCPRSQVRSPRRPAAPAPKTAIRAALLITCQLAIGGGLYAQSPATAIQGARVFTGDEVLDRATVVIRGRTIESVTPGTDIPAGAGADVVIVEAQGMTLLPGLIDSHTHNFGPSLEQALNFGVTTVLDMLTDANIARQWRRQQAEGRATERADVFAGGPVTVKGGHGTQFGISLPTLDDPEQTEAFIADRAAEGADFIKVIYEAGETARPIPTHAASTLPRIVAAAYSHDLLAVFHISTTNSAREAIAAGADGLVHIFYDSEGSDDTVRAVHDAEAFVVPTLAVIEAVAGSGGGNELAADPLIAPFLMPDQRGSLDRDFGRELPEVLEHAIRNTRALHEAGVPILAGSDAPNPGTTHGASVHRELELLVTAGLTAAEALRAATAAPADAFDLDDRGRIAAGLKADLLLVRGDATADVLATRDIEAIWKDGTPVERRLAEEPTGRRQIDPTLLSDFEGLDGNALPGSAWARSTDAQAGGKSTVETTITSRGEAGSALRIEGEIKEGFPFPWSGIMVLLGSQFNDPVDAGGIRALAFDARGDCETCQAMAFAESLGMRPAATSFQAGEEWSQVEIPLSSFGGLDPSGASAFFIGGPTDLGAFWLEIDNVELVE